jgi:hypothetical protein
MGQWFNRLAVVSVALGVLASSTGRTLAAEDAKAIPTTLPAVGKVGKLPFLTFDTRTKQIRVECETLGVEAPLEFFAVVNNGPEHEAVVRSKVKPSDLHTSLLALGLKPGAPVTYSKAADKWLPPHGPPLHIYMEYLKDGKLLSEPANRWMRDIRTKKIMPRTTWIFAGSRVMPDGNYAADSTGYLVSVVNFDMTVIDIPELASANNETLEWERNPEAVPKAGTKVTMVIEPAGKEATSGPATQPAAPPKPDGLDANVPASPRSSVETGGGVSDVKLDEALLARATQKWEAVVAPKAAALREAAQAHYDTINALRREQQRLIDEADRVQRAIDTLEKRYQDMTTPSPTPDTEPAAAAAPDAAAPRATDPTTEQPR